MEFNASTSVETLFCASNPKAVENAISGIMGKLSLVDGISSVVGQGLDIASDVTDLTGVGCDTLKKAKELNEKVGKTTGTLGGILTKLIDSLTKTTKGTDTNATDTNITISTGASNEDVLYFTDTIRYIWRYKILTKLAPAWLKGQPKGGASYSGTSANDYENFITFTICDPNSAHKTIFGMGDSRYQPFHEPGNLFSYPAALADVPGYADRRQLTDQVEVGSTGYSQTLKFTKSTGKQENKTEEVKVGFITSTVSMLNRIFGSSDTMNIPQAADPETFTRNVSTAEALDVTLQQVDLGSRYNTAFEGYLDASGAMTMAFTVTNFDTYDSLCTSKSLYRQRPDLSLVLPYKFSYQSDSQTFGGNTNDNKAYQMKGVRFYCVEDSASPIASSNILVKGLKYRIEIPVYNASFVDAGSVTVRLSYAASNKYNAKKTRIANRTVTLKGWTNGVNCATVAFDWTPATSVASGNYYLFAEIDPSNAITEFHESRKNSKGAIVDFGGNNLGYFPFSLANAGDKSYEGRKPSGTGTAVSLAADDEDAYFPFRQPYMNIVNSFADNSISISFKLNGMETFKDFYDSYIANADGDVPVTVEFTCTGINVDVIPNVTVEGYSLNFNEAVRRFRDKILNGEEMSEEEEVALLEQTLNLIITENVTLFPGQNYEVYLTLSEKDIENIRESYQNLEVTGLLFGIEVPEKAVASSTSTNSDSSDSGSSDSENTSSRSSSSGSSGCDAGLSGVLGLLSLLGLAALRRKK